MPKLKTHKGTAKRIKKTATGKLLRRRSGSNHKLFAKRESRKRVIATMAQVRGKLVKNINRALGE